MTTEKKADEHQDILKGSMSLVLVLVLTVFGSLLIIFLSGTNPLAVHGDYGTLGDFIGGIMNPLLTFGTVMLLIFTIRQNQDVIKQSQTLIEQGQELNNQNQSIIELNIDELKTSNIELRASQEALHKDANTNQIKLQLEIIEIITKKFHSLTGIKVSGSNHSIQDFMNSYSSFNKEDQGWRESNAIKTLFRDFRTEEGLSQIEKRERMTNENNLASIVIHGYVFNTAVRKIIEIDPNLVYLFREHEIADTIFNIVNVVKTYELENEKQTKRFSKLNLAISDTLNV
ncbi:MAG: hypothetical protein V7785_20410 [Bermanella sp.]